MPDPEKEAVLAVVTTAPDAGAAETLAQRLVEERLAACANVLPGVRSVYRWKGAVERANEVLVVFKTAPGSYEAVRDRILELHPYDVPEILALPIALGSEDYVAWVLKEVEAP